MSMPAFMAMRMASFLVAAMWSRTHRLLMSAQSVTIMPSQLRPSFSQSVSRVLLAWNGMPMLMDELGMSVSAPARAAWRKGMKYFSRISLSPTADGVRSRPVTGTP